MQEDEDALEIWGGGLKELNNMKADVSQYVPSPDAALLQEQVDELHSQWEELCLKVSVFVFGERERRRETEARGCCPGNFEKTQYFHRRGLGLHSQCRMARKKRGKWVT